MQPDDLGGRAAARRAGLDLVQGWTWAVAVGAIGLTGVLGIAAADTFHGHQSAAAATTTSSDAGASTTTSGSSEQGGITPQAPADSTFGGGLQPPVVVSGGS
ncbi:MAG TPA: hypothetical protein VET65_03125 [Candidatus Limnocylindrales bacterium]|nr:hypothetical protein [Candidatus Limnocylindrales bacterium]